MGLKIKTGKNEVMAIILKENKGIVFHKVNINKDVFRFDHHVYFITNEGAYLDTKRGAISLIYLEGVSTPLSHKHIKYKMVKQKIINNITNKEETHETRQIEGLKFDSKAIDVILNQKLAEMFTRIPMDVPNLILTILLLGTFAIGIVNIGMWFL